MRWFLLLFAFLSPVNAQGVKHMDVQGVEVGRLLMLSFSGTEAPLAQLEAIRPAGFIFFSGNVESAQQTRALTRQLQAVSPYPLLFGVDQEGGTVSTLREAGWTLFSRQSGARRGGRSGAGAGRGGRLWGVSWLLPGLI